MKQPSNNTGYRYHSRDMKYWGEAQRDINHIRHPNKIENQKKNKTTGKYKGILGTTIRIIHAGPAGRIGRLLQTDITGDNKADVIMSYGK